MCIFKTKKKARYLQNIHPKERTAFDMLLAEYLDGSLKGGLQSLEIAQIEIYVDWQNDHKCIGVQGRYKNYYMDLQIYPDEFKVAFDLDEADEDETYALTSKEQFYQILSDTICNLE